MLATVSPLIPPRDAVDRDLAEMFRLQGPRGRRKLRAPISSRKVGRRSMRKMFAVAPAAPDRCPAISRQFVRLPAGPGSDCYGPTTGRFTSWCGSCAKARRSLGIRALGETQMRKIIFGRNCVNARWCRSFSLGHLDYSGAYRRASRCTDQSVADHDGRKRPACCPL